MTIDDTGFDYSDSSQYTDPVKPGVYAAALSPDDTIYAAGYFAKAGDDSALNVARWNGTAWDGMGYGLLSPTGNDSNVVENIIVGIDDTNYADDTVYAIGELTGICTNASCGSNTPVDGFAQWRDDTWYVMGAGNTNDKVFAGAYKDDTLYVGGKFTQIQGRNIARLAAWRESDDTWVTVGNWQPSQQVAALTVHPTTGDIYAAGYFSDDSGAGGARLSGVARYKVADDTWYPVGNWTTNVDVAALDFDPTGTYLYVGGRFTSVSGTTFNRVAILSGGSFGGSSTVVGGTWQYLRSAGVIGVNASVRSIVANSDGSAYVAGDFTTAGPIAAGRVALFTPGPEPSPYDPVYPADAPTDVVATPGWNKVTVDWTAPKYTGSYPITNYLVQATPGGQVCITRLTDPKLNQCTYTSLTPGVNYTFRVQALNGAGWGDRSLPSNVASPYNLKITNYQRRKLNFFLGGGSKVTVGGSAAGYANGTRITPWIMWGNSGTWEEQKSSNLSASGGKFTWERKFPKGKNSQALSVKFSVNGDFSNTASMGPVR
ncbi:MAG: fibronectin type III domain-containing protein [bacterium]